jgi:Putative zinc-finger
MSTIEHTDVGAYALGLLEDDDRLAFEEHLAGCAACRAELGDFSGMASALQDVDLSLLTATGLDEQTDPPADLGTDLPAPVTSHGPADTATTYTYAGSGTAEVDERASIAPDATIVRLRRRREQAGSGPRLRTDQLLAAAAAIVLLVGGVLVGSWVSGGQDAPGNTPDSVHRPAGELLLTGDRFSTSDRATGATGVIGIESRGWGTHIALELRGVRGPLACQLFAVSRDGERQVAMSWKVPRAGYGVPGAPDPLVLHGATSMPRSDVDRVEIRTSDGKTLLAVPVPA